MSNPEYTTVSFRLPAQLVAALDKIVIERKPEIRDRTQLISIVLTKYVQDSGTTLAIQ
jgi:metal-responsive CopG/Arc/MetJ family transcriptional regulator